MIVEIEVALPTACAICRAELGPDRVLATETDYPGLELDGDPLRLVGWCRPCAPAWAVELEEKQGELLGGVDDKARIELARTRGGPVKFEP